MTEHLEPNSGNARQNNLWTSKFHIPNKIIRNVCWIIENILYIRTSIIEF